MSPASSLVTTESTRDQLVASACDRERHIIQLGDAIATLAARLHAATYDLLVLLREFDECAGWNNGCLSCAHWLHWRTGIDLGAAREKLRVARALATLPRISAAMRCGELSYASRRITCNSSLVMLRHAPDGAALDVGRKTRTIPTAIRRARLARDRHCQFPGCTARRCDGHHIQHWIDGGPTLLDNLTLLCRRHHRAVHEGGFAMVQRDDGPPMFYRPDGICVESAPRTHQGDADRSALLTGSIEVGPFTAMTRGDPRPSTLAGRSTSFVTAWRAAETDPRAHAFNRGQSDIDLN
jgi:hypothetical protein